MMNYCLKKIDAFNQHSMLIYMIASSMLLAAWMQYIQHGWLNPDSVLYFEQGRLFAAGKWQKAVEIFNWPFFGACIGFIHKITPFSIHQSAQFLSMLFFGMATASYLWIIKLAGGNNRTLFFGALLLFSSQSIVGDSLEMLMRGQGAWGFYLSAIAFLICYYLTKHVIYALLWQACIMIATLFRIEYIMYLFLLPLAGLFLLPHNFKTSLSTVFKTYSLSILAGLLIITTFIVEPESTMTQFGRLDEVFNKNLWQELTRNLLDKADIMANQVLGIHLDEYAIEGLLLTFVYVMIVKLIDATGLITIGLGTFAIRHSNKLINEVPRKLMLAIIGIATLTASLIIIKVFVLSGRYIFSLSWILFVFASFSLSELSYKESKKLKVVLTVICIFLCLGFIKNILPKAEGYNYRQNAVHWIKQRNKNNQPVFYDESRLVHFANQPFKGGWNNTWNTFMVAFENKSIYDNQFIAINHTKKHLERVKFIETNLPEFEEVHRTYNRKKKKFIVIYKKKSIN